MNSNKDDGACFGPTLKAHSTEKKCAQFWPTPDCAHLRQKCMYILNPLTPNGPYSGRTAPLTSKRCILYIYSTNTGTEYFKHGIYCPFFLFKMQFVS